MAQAVENSPKPTRLNPTMSSENKPSAEKRKLEADSDDELFFAYESTSKAKKNDSGEAEKVVQPSSAKKPTNKEESTSIGTPKNKTEVSNKENSKPVVNLAQKLATASPKPLDSPKSNKLMIQQKLSFSPSVQKPSEKEKPQELPKPIVRPNGEWLIEDFLLDEQWKKWLNDEFEKPYFKEINRIIREGYKKNILRPPKELVFNALNSTKLDKIKVVIIGQDPYHDDGQAHGLCFSVPKGIALPPSLRNIFTELQTDLPNFKRNESLGGCLQKWTTEGVFLLNTFLTVEAHKAGSHSKIGWDIFTDRVIKLISEKNSGCAFLLWGNFAQKKEGLIDKKKHCVIKSAHPSPFSVTRFYGSKPFSKANEFLKSIGKTPVNWNLE